MASTGDPGSPQAVGEDIELRMRTLSEKGDDLYSQQKDKYLAKLVKIETELKQILQSYSSHIEDKDALQTLRIELTKAFHKYDTLTSDFVSFLTRRHTDDSLKEKSNRLLVFQNLSAAVSAACKDIDTNLNRTPSTDKHTGPPAVVKSRASSSTKTGPPVMVKSRVSSSNHTKSKKSSSLTDSELFKQKAKAEAAKAALDFERQELELRRESARVHEEELRAKAAAERRKMEMEAEIRLLNMEKEAAVAAAAYQACFDVDDDITSISSSLPLGVGNEEDPRVRTQEYVKSLPNQAREDERKTYGDEPNPFPDRSNSFPSHLSEPPYVTNYHTHADIPTSNNKPRNLNPTAQIFTPGGTQGFTDFTKFLLRKDLLLQRFTTFDDRPETFNVWKVSFQSIISELCISPLEEFDLLIKWLGPESKRSAVSLRASNVSNPAKGIKRLWERLYERYGCPEMVESSLKEKLSKFPKLGNKDNARLYELSDILSEIESAMEDPKYSSLLSYFNTSSGILPIACKLPFHIQGKWTMRATKYKRDHKASFPPFSEFVTFIREMSCMLNDPGLSFTEVPSNSRPKDKNISRTVRVAKTEIVQTADEQEDRATKNKCFLHNSSTHTLNQCRLFRNKSLGERKRLLSERHMCYRCCESDQHIFKNCTMPTKCSDCGSTKHPTALHPKENSNRQNSSPKHGGESPSVVKSMCTDICGEHFSGRSCSKTILVKVHCKENPEHTRLMYAILDDQSSSTLCRTEFFETMNVTDTSNTPYTLVSCGGDVPMQGRRAQGIVVSAVDDSFHVTIPSVLECNKIPDAREEIPTPEVANFYGHLNGLPIPQLDPDAKILLLIGRDVPEAHHVEEQRTGPHGSPFAQKLGLGWAIVGNVCIGGAHVQDKINVLKTWVVKGGRPTVFPPCSNQFVVKERNDVFQQTKDDNKLGLSCEDREFIDIMDKEFVKHPKGHWVAPLPFRNPRPRLPNNQTQAIKRAQQLHANLQRNPTKRDHLITFMEGILANGHAERAPPLTPSMECWYLPLFGVYHPKKPNKIRGVFDSSAQYQGISLNQVLVKGPDLANSLLGVLIRFRKEDIAVTADVEQMFYCFSVKEDHRDFLRFIWYEDNDFSKELVHYRMCKHVFGNSPSPAVATYGLRRTVQEVEDKFGEDVRTFVENDFYVDDGLVSLPSVSEAVSLFKRTQEALNTSDIRLHKISSNSQEFLSAFQPRDLASDLKDLELGSDTLPTQRSLGMSWDLQSDTFLYCVSRDQKPYTRRGVLSTINSLFDPIGFLSPVTIQGKILLRDMMEKGTDWDDPLPAEFNDKWKHWVHSLLDLESIRIPRRYNIFGKEQPELHVYTDASERAISAVVYSRSGGQLSFLMGKSKVAPKSGHTIPRLELCAAVLGIELAEIITEELGMDPTSVLYHTDSKVVLGYLNNRTRRFFIYVTNRVSRILSFSSPEQWSYVSTDENPADQGTRYIHPSLLATSPWIQGPVSLRSCDVTSSKEMYPLISPESDTELRPELSIHVVKTSVMSESGLGVDRFDRFSKWTSLLRGLSFLCRSTHRIRSRINSSNHGESNYGTSSTGSDQEQFVVKEIQEKYYPREIKCLASGNSVPRDSHVLRLSPFLDESGVLRVGGRLQRSNLPYREKCPILIPGPSHVATLLVRHFHKTVSHQGRHFTEGAIRAAGYWITGAKRLVSCVVHRCVTCRRLRGKVCSQKMADLPSDRLTPTPPFTCVGVDVFGPWNVTTRKTRGGSASSKRWAVLYTCMTTRAIHIELIEEMTSSSFINATRRFYAIRGKVQEFRSDCGTNFVGAVQDLDIQAIHVGDKVLQEFLSETSAVWKFNPPHASHFGGTWERMIGVVRRILDALLMESKSLTHEILSTFMAEVMAIVNARPLVPVSTDPDSPYVLSPSVLLTQKLGSNKESFAYLDVKDTFRSQWKYVQFLAEQFWGRWRREYLPTIQSKRKWTQEERNLEVGDVVILKEESETRNDWPMGVITRSFPSEDSLVRKVEVRVAREGKTSTFVRPITKVILLSPK